MAHISKSVRHEYAPLAFNVFCAHSKLSGDCANTYADDSQNEVFIAVDLLHPDVLGAPFRDLDPLRARRLVHQGHARSVVASRPGSSRM